MHRALTLAAHGAPDAMPNPMVGAVIVCDGKIIGEGFHRRCGEPHAEVNAIRSVRNPQLLKRSTIYVTLEPCSHYGKTPPCAKLIIEKKIPRVVVGCYDTFPSVSGRGIEMLRSAGVEVTIGILEKECLKLNERFITAHSRQMPWIELKWAQSADKFIGTFNEQGHPQALTISTPLTQTLAHAERSRAEAIIIGGGTLIADNPRLDLRLWPGKSPRPVIITSHNIPDNYHLKGREDLLIYHTNTPLTDIMKNLYNEHKITSVLVEGGAKLLKSFINANLYDEIRIETSPQIIDKGVSAPNLPNGLHSVSEEIVCGHKIERLRR